MCKRLNAFGYIPGGPISIYEIINGAHRDIRVIPHPCRSYQDNTKSKKQKKVQRLSGIYIHTIQELKRKFYYIALSHFPSQKRPYLKRKGQAVSLTLI